MIDKAKITNQLNPLFEVGLINDILAQADVVHLAHGERLIDSGQVIRKMPLVLEGSIKVSRIDQEGNELFLYNLMPLETCAMTVTCCMQQYPSEIQAEADGELTLLAIPIQRMDEWLVRYPSWKGFIMRNIKTRFEELLKAIDQIAFQKLDDRLVHYLREKSRITGSSLINLSHQQIADDLASSRVVISRLLKKLENDKKLLLYRNQIKLLRDFSQL
ncbi:MAG: Crp/Fnr family transcriptional regulator [Saprospiraceae bacterium]|nr:Crp/Fnr family transcriptional regulator [Saprospiraceae bacterium]MBP9209859.1 Crp/Fnr family transcriptional regulator [Saprospiraceae bacterium]MBV6473755.1 Global nitrogen regulator [Saprospiraceae bacterium]